MDFSLSSAQKALQAEIITFAQSSLNKDVWTREQQGTFDHYLWKLCGEQGLLGLAISEDFGGRGLSALDTVIALEALGYGCEDNGLSFAIGAQLFACMIPIWLHGTLPQKAELLPALCAGERIATNAMTEAHGGSASFDMQSEAIKVPGGYRLTGVKSYCANAPVADICLAYFPTDAEKGFFGGISAFLLEKKKHAFGISETLQKLGLTTCKTGKITFDQLGVRNEALLGKAGAGGMIFTQSMQWERIGLSALHLGSMKRLLENAVSFAKQRTPGGIPIAKHQAISHQLAEMQAQISASKWLVYYAAWQLSHRHQVQASSSIAKLFTSETYKAMCLKLVQIYGGLGYLADHEASRSLKDAVAATLYSGTSEIQKNIIARGMGL